MEEYKSKVRSTRAQLQVLVEYMASHRKFANNEFSGPIGAQRYGQEWAALRVKLSQSGPDKTVDQWKQTWRDLKRKARKVHGLVGAQRPKPKPEPSSPQYTDDTIKVLKTIGYTSSDGLEVGLDDSESFSKDKDEVVVQSGSKHDSNFKRVRAVCVALIKECGRPLEMLDDEPFRQLINMIVKKEGDRQQLTAAAIMSYIESNEEGDGGDDDHHHDDDMEQDMNEGEVDSDDGAVEEYEVPIPSREIKGEVMSCTCQPRHDGNGHDSNCALSGVPHYWEYFEVSIDEAKCKECHKKIKWTMMSDLKTHLVVFHSKISFKDDDDNYFEDHNASSEISYQEQEEVFVDNMATLKPEPAAKKRKLPPSTKPVFVALRDSEKICLDRFKSLDRFGLYVASLLKLLPEQKSIRYQEQIINRLLKEQPAAG